MTTTLPGETFLTESLADSVAMLAEHRTALAELQSEYNTRLLAFHAEHQPLMDELSSRKARLQEVEGMVRSNALMLFEQTGNKKLVHGVGIRETRTLTYDPDKALEWALQHHLALQLDTKTFQKLMLAMDASQRPDWVTEELVPTATIPTTIKLEAVEDGID